MPIKISHVFLFLLIVSVGYLCFLVFKPFLEVILVATILATIFYRPYEKLAAILRGRKNLAALIMCMAIALLVIIPTVQILLYAAQKSDSAFNSTRQFLNSFEMEKFLDSDILKGFETGILSEIDLRNALVDLAGNTKDWILAETGGLLVGTANFVFSLFMIFFIMFFFFVDGKGMVDKLMYWTPLPNKYDREIFKKFKDVSYSTIVSTFVTAIAQGFIGSLAFIITGLPAFFPGLAMGFLSLLPYAGAAFVWFPAGVYLLFAGKIWQGVFMLVWGAAVVSLVDNLIRGYLIKGKAQVHPIFIIISILGGIALFGFWGVFFGPLIISLAVTVMHIYEMEYIKELEK